MLGAVPEWMVPPPAGVMARVLRGGRGRKPQLLLLDHGSYVHLGEKLRLQYCQLWCSFMLNDVDTSRQVRCRHAPGASTGAATATATATDRKCHWHRSSRWQSCMR